MPRGIVVNAVLCMYALIAFLTKSRAVSHPSSSFLHSSMVCWASSWLVKRPTISFEGSATMN
jgi:hypothetical protein